MERNELLCKSIKKIAWGYVFLYFDINLGTIDVLPAFWGYWLFYKAIRDGISLEEENANLLKPIAIVLVIYQSVLWILHSLGIATDILLVSEFRTILSLYFHFQLLTNLANIARRYQCPQEKALLRVRTIQTILLTILAFTTPFEDLYAISLILVVVQIVIIVCLCFVLRDFKHTLEDVLDIHFYNK